MAGSILFVHNHCIAARRLSKSAVAVALSLIVEWCKHVSSTAGVCSWCGGGVGEHVGPTNVTDSSPISVCADPLSLDENSSVSMIWSARRGGLGSGDAGVVPVEVALTEDPAIAFPAGVMTWERAQRFDDILDGVLSRRGERPIWGQRGWISCGHCTFRWQRSNYSILWYSRRFYCHISDRVYALGYYIANNRCCGERSR